MSERATLNKLELLRDKLCCLIENSTSSNTLLQEVADSLVLANALNNIDFEMAMVIDSNDDTFQLVFEKDEETGAITTSYIDADGNPATPVGAVTFGNSISLLTQIDGVLDTIKIDTGQIVINTSVPTSVTDYVEVATVDVNTWNAATSFTSDVISFVGRDKNLPWSFQIVDYAITPGTPTLTLEVSLNGTDFTNYKTASTLIDMTDTANNAFVFDDVASFEYMRFVYTSNASTGSFSLLFNK